MKYKGVIFDLDGVIVSTDNLHFLAWEKLALRENIYFNRIINEKLRGISRFESLEIILKNAKKRYTNSEKEEMANYKNEEYKKLLTTLSPKDKLVGVQDFLDFLKREGVKMAIGSSSKNTMFILKRIKLENFFDAVADGNDIKNSKPDPEVFLCACKKLGLSPNECLVIEDAFSGVDAGLSAGCDVLGVGSAKEYEKATYHAKDLSNFQTLEFIKNK